MIIHLPEAPFNDADYAVRPNDLASAAARRMRRRLNAMVERHSSPESSL